MISEKIKAKIENIEKGEIFSAIHFLELAERPTINKILSKMSEKEEIKRVSRGLYYVPIESRFGKVPADTINVINAIIQKTGEKIQIHGAEAARRLRLSTQMPLSRVFYTSGRSRELIVEGARIKFIHTDNKRKLQFPLEKTGLIISALHYFGKQGMNKKRFKELKEQISEAEWEKLKRADLANWMKSGLGIAA